MPFKLMNHLKEFFGFGDPNDTPDPDLALVAGQIEDLRWLMSDKRGRRVMWRVLEQAGVYRSSYTGDNTTFFNEGQRNMGLWLMDEITTHCLTEYTEMLKENR